MATRAEIRKKLGIVTLEDPSVTNKELSEKDALEYENFMKSLLDFNKEIDENIKSFCSRCKYYGTKEADKCDSLIHGCSYGVDCKYIGKAKGEDMSRYENRKIMDF